MTLMKIGLPALLALCLSACSLTESAPLGTLSPGAHAQEIRRDQTANLTQVGTASVTVYGNPMNAAELIQKKADAMGAHYYFVTNVEPTQVPNQWISQAILYR
ncbi:biofilm peroxide resistance protein BsmA [Chimaeribacter arupi]|uniref:Biofilm peroxide resistance protein BsmA n=2 Tax=Yersiniaceae TaxID=1903411 RepID=A0A2N5ET78_9GAMM|nr:MULTISPECIES: biofilm peroxide resistance protein BsmA [Yersiniaceae]MBS0969937.1 biofilm peroxide resistance protein BsmA [Nissabacter archeti]MDV5139975.1 biofilm peroxide resistance protein BsmA [Chimaeribacter arupi]PLR39982.1 biofilm peroxide resistance protein BsmA [Chimaeribacter arupi]PLR49611.1 biofilm peroxide resistance protein BsmA [Chimaeribacter arupi]PLR51315.1 biofilm peroxide resistance protein BsmA [Chimaeribacter arupi]